MVDTCVRFIGFQFNKPQPDSKLLSLLENLPVISYVSVVPKPRTTNLVIALVQRSLVRQLRDDLSNLRCKILIGEKLPKDLTGILDNYTLNPNSNELIGEIANYGRILRLGCNEALAAEILETW